jgi:ubiquinone/menaquinone biosynthesis C-methylase UbiE
MFIQKQINFNKKDSITKKRCVLCSSLDLQEAINFGSTPLANSYPKYFNSRERYFDLYCILCKKCGHLQLGELINPELMFSNYLYVSGTSKVLVDHFKKYSQKLIKKFNLNQNSSVLDIACNDGTFLEFFKNEKFKKVVGVDPAKNLRKLNKQKKIDINTGYFSFDYSKKLKKKYKEFNIITANNVFAHSPNLQNFTQGVKNLLSKKGVFTMEVSYLMTVVEKKTFDTIYHEHMSYHALSPLIKFFKNFDLEVFDFELIEAQGGSIRIYVSHKKAKVINKKKIKKQIIKEKNKNLFNIKTYKNFYLEILEQKKILRKIINKAKKEKSIIGYGAPAKLTTLSHMFDLNNDDIRIVVDDNKLKQNRYSPGKKFLIKNFNFLKKNKKKYNVIIILAWNFFDSIKKKCMNLKGNFVFIKPFPKPKIY